MYHELKSYTDILLLPHPQPRHKRMPLYERAAQFAPFAALTGFGARICEAARLVDSRPSVSAEEAREINEQLNILIKQTSPLPVRLTYFVPDGKKQGGALFEKEGEVRWVDSVARRLFFTDKTEIPIDDIFALAILAQS